MEMDKIKEFFSKMNPWYVVPLLFLFPIFVLVSIITLKNFGGSVPYVFFLFYLLAYLFYSVRVKKSDFVDDYPWKPTDKIPPVEGARNLNWIVIPFMIFVSWIMYNAFMSREWITALLGLLFLSHVVSTFFMVDYQNIVVFFLFGKPIGQSGPNWYFLLKPIVTCQIMSTKEILINVKCVTMYTSTGNPIDADVLLGIRLFDGIRACMIANDSDGSREGLQEDEYWMSLPTYQKKAVLSAMSAFRTLAGKKKFEDINKTQERAEKSAKDKVNSHINKIGYAVTQFDIFNIDEKIESQAAAKRVIGTAEAEMKGLETEAIRKGADGASWQTSVVFLAQTFGEAFAKRMAEKILNDNED